MAAENRSVPFAEEAEMGVIAAMLIDRDAVPIALELLDERAFYLERNRLLFQCIVRLFERNEVPDPITVSEELKREGTLEAAGGLEYLGELLDAVPTSAHIEHHARVVRDRWTRRRLLEAANAIVNDVHETEQLSELLDRAGEHVFRVSNESHRTGLVLIGKTLFNTFERLEEMHARGEALSGLSTGLIDLDEMTGGFQRGNFIVLAARPSMGKTGAAVGFLLEATVVQRVPSAIFSLEMTRDELNQRALAWESRVDLSRLIRGNLHDDEYARIAQAAGNLQSAPLYIDDTGGLTMLELRAKTRRLKSEVPELGLVVVDYIQLMHADQGRGSRRYENRQQEVSALSRGLKSLAKELEVPVIGLSQLSRNPENRSDKRPQLSDLRESGSLEQDADLVMFLYRPEYYMTEQEATQKGLRSKAELIIAKQRNGPTGSVDLFFRRECVRFENGTWGVPTGGES